MIDESKFLLPEPDGLPTRKSQKYANYKLNALARYLSVTNTAMRNTWSIRYYIDLQAGSGKNNIGSSVVLGSPLIALTSPHCATHFRFNELDTNLYNSLNRRLAASPFADRVVTYQMDVNKIVDTVCDEIKSSDKKQGSLNIAFLDPNGLELHWSTVAKLASIKRMDLIINFSTQGLFRVTGTENVQSVDRFFGTTAWRELEKFPHNPVKRRRVLIDFYLERLRQYGYHIVTDRNLGGGDLTANNSKNSQVYSMIFASKHPLGDKFWKQAAKSVKPPQLPGFD